MCFQNIAGKWIVGVQWVLDCLEFGKLCDEQQYEVDTMHFFLKMADRMYAMYIGSSG